MAKILEFEEIDNLFLKYKEASTKANTEKYIEKVKNDIVSALWNNLCTKKKIVELLTENADIMVKTTIYCIKKYSEYGNYEGFSAYTTKAIKNKLSTTVIDSSFQESTGGMHISDNFKKIQNSLKRLYKSFSSLRKSNTSEEELNNCFVEYASKYLNIEKYVVIDFLNPKKATRIEKNNSEDDSYDITDIFGGSNTYSPEKIFEQNESNNEILSKINDEWNKQKEDSKLLMSELLTLSIIEAIEKNYLNIESTSLEPYSFINRKMMKVYFFNHDEEIPTKQQIGEKYKLTKSGVSKKLSRFFEKIKN